MKSTIKLLTSLLEGKILNCKTIMKDFGYSNASREIIRKIEQPFEITLKREKVSSKNRYGESVTYLNYSLLLKDKPKVNRILKEFNLKNNG
jgi:hypothetical protein